MKQRIGRFLPSSLLSLSLLLNSPSVQPLEEQTVLAALALNIVRFTTWPAEVGMKKRINFCVLGDNVVQQAFASIDNKAVGHQNLNIINLSRLSNFEPCHVLYISQLKQNVLLPVFVEIKNRPLLSIGEGRDFAVRGGMVGLGNGNGKITLYINLPVVHESNLNISARLLKLAKIIGH